MEKQLVVAKKNIPLSDGSSVEIDDVGIIESQSLNEAHVFFIRVWENVTMRKEDLGDFNVKETGDLFPEKICNVCHKLLDTTLFDKNQNGINNRPVRRPSCKTCRKILDGMNIKPAARSKWKEQQPVSEPFECPICGKRTIAGVTSKVVLDHNHLTGEPRAWICDSCNTGIGRFQDNIEILQRAIKFLE